MSASKDSPAIQLLQMVWDHCQQSTGHSWLKLNHAMREALSLAVRAGMRFDEGDFIRIHRQSQDGGFRAGYWIGSDSEWFYSLAVLYRHADAWKAYEKYAGRKPFIVDGARIHAHTGDGPCGSGLPRLIVGAEFEYKGERLRVNSFRDQANPPYFNAVLVVTPNQSRGKITHAMLAEDRKEQRAKVRLSRRYLTCAKCHGEIRPGDAIRKNSKGTIHDACPAKEDGAK